MNNISLCIPNHNNAKAFRIVLNEWLSFIGERPAEIIIIDGGTENRTFQVYAELFKEGLIDKLFVLNPDHVENNKDLCYIQEFWAGALSSNEYIMYIKSDTLPYRKGHEDWLNEYKSLLDDPKIFSISGSYNTTEVLGEYNDDFYYLQATSENFCMMKRKNFFSSLDFLWKMVKKGWQCENPYSKISSTQARCLIEVAWNNYCQQNDLIVLARKETPYWTIFHTNLKDNSLLKALDKYKSRENIEHFMNSSGKYYSGHSLILNRFIRALSLISRGGQYLLHGNIVYLVEGFKRRIKTLLGSRWTH